jgi:hypothetical protein
MEKTWADGWSPTLLYSETEQGDTAGSIFTAVHSDEPETIWYVNRFDVQEGVIEYLRITPGITLAVLDIRCQALGETITQASVTYTFTALSEMGNTRIDHLIHHHPQSVRGWEKVINHYLKTGEVLSHS